MNLSQVVYGTKEFLRIREAAAVGLPSMEERSLSEACRRSRNFILLVLMSPQANVPLLWMRRVIGNDPEADAPA